MSEIIKIFVDYRESGKTRVHFTEPFSDDLDTEKQLIEVAEKYEGKPDLNIDVRYLNTYARTWSLIYSYYPTDKKFIKH